MHDHYTCVKYGCNLCAQKLKSWVSVLRLLDVEVSVACETLEVNR